MREFTSGKNTFYDKIKWRSKRNRIKQRNENFEIKFSNTKAVNKNNCLRISILRAKVSYLSLQAFNFYFYLLRGYNGGCGAPTAVIASQQFFILFF